MPINTDEGTLATEYARSVMHTIGLVTDRHGGALEVADAIFGPGCLERAPLRTEGCVGLVGGRWRLFINARLPPARRHWQIAFQTASWLVRRDGADVSVARLAALLLLPADPVSRLLATHGPIAVARAFVVPEVSVYLREGELNLRPVAHVVPGSYVCVRGAASRQLPNDRAALETLAVGHVMPLRVTRARSVNERGVVLHVKDAA